MNAGSPGKYVLKLFIAGHSPRSELAIRSLERICEQEIRGPFELIVIDVIEQPQKAEEGRILATPTVVKERPLPMRRAIGDLSDKQKVLTALGL